MQAVPLAALNSSVMAAFNSPSLSPSSAELAQTLGKIAPPVYEISATASSQENAVEDKCSIGDEMVTYTTQYYSTIESQSRPSSTSTEMAASPKHLARHMTPVSVSSKESTSSEVMSPIDDDVGEVLSHQGGVCIPSSSAEIQREGNGTTQVKHWTYEDQFKQLYNLSQEQDRKEFLDKLFNFMQAKGTPITRVPIMAKQPLDLYKLFNLVVERGGLVEVIKKKAWRNVAKELNLPASITSAAFTMRSQYVKYLYPYECETVKLSDPQELQIAIDSNKRDRRHSENMEFIAPQLQREIELNPVVTTTPQGLQLIGSPTMAFPHGSLPPYSGGFIVTGGPGGTRVVASPQLVQMAPHVQGIPIVMPAVTQAPPTTNHSHSSSEDRDDIQSQDSGDSNMEPPATKRPALAAPATTISSNRGGPPSFSIHQTNAGNFIMAHGGVAPSGGTHLIQMTPHGQIPIVLPTTPTSTREQGCPTPPNVYVNGRTEHKSTENGSAVVSGTSHHSNVILNQRSSNPPSSHNLFQRTHNKIPPGLIIPQPLVGATPVRPHTPAHKEREDEEQQEKSCTNTAAVVKMPAVANISIQSAGGKTDGIDQNSGGASLLVTLDINNTVYQGVLFAKPQSISSPQR